VENQNIDKNKHDPAERMHFEIGVTTENYALIARAQEIARRFGLVFVSPLECAKIPWCLHLSAKQLELRAMNRPELATPFRIDFTHGALRFRRVHGGREMLSRALGINKGRRPDVLDATAGLGRDGFLIAAAGCRVTLCERHPAVMALLEDAHVRALQYPETRDIAARMKFQWLDAILLFEKKKAAGEDIEAIYLDPMFPIRSKTAKVKKELQLLQFLLGTDNDSTSLFQAALATASQRVVVKRPVNAPPLAGKKPSHSLEGKTTRFDVYMTAR
jgi:16S rRNA (guanine1516-N2)-methyltransferase